MSDPATYPVKFDVEYQDRELNRLTTFFRIFMIIPIAIVLTLVIGPSGRGWDNGGGGAFLLAFMFLPVLLMLVFREKYPRWWFDWNLQLARFIARVHVYFACIDDRYPSTDEQQSVTLELPYPAQPGEVNRWLPLVKWFLAIPHYIVLFFLGIGVFFVVIFGWFAVLFTGRYPRTMFDFIVGVSRWGVRVHGYAFLLVTDEYPPFSLD